MSLYMDFLIFFFLATTAFFAFSVIEYSVYRQYEYDDTKRHAQRRLRLATVLVPLSIFWPILAVGVVGYGLYLLGKGTKTLVGWLLE